MSEVFFINKEGFHSIDNKLEIKRISQTAERKIDFGLWSKMRPVYIHTWVWKEICERYPQKYKMFLPVYQGQKVILT